MISSIPTEFTLPKLSRGRQKTLLGFATQVLEAQQQMMGNKGENLLHYVLNKKPKYESMSHYPKGDRIDHSTGSQYFYHCHRENFESHEHGHFHCLMRYKFIAKRIKPVFSSDRCVKNPMTHLVAIAMNQFGEAIRLFTVNQWVSSEIWYEAKHIDYLIKRYKMTVIDPYWQVLDKWVEGMLHLFAPQISWLHQARDQKILQYQALNPKGNPYTDPSLEELSEICINLKEQIEWVMYRS